MDKELINLCIKYNQPIPVIFEKSWYNPFLKEYNIDTSAGHPTDEGDDIVRYSLETRRVKDKEP